MLSSALLVLFFSYGHVYQVVKTVQFGGVLIGRHRILLPLWSLAAVAAAWLVLRKGADLRPMTAWLNLVSIVALCIPLATIGADMARNRAQIRPATAPIESLGQGAPALDPSTLPDVYYIIPDAYGRSDILKRDYGFDNTSFIEFLEKRGFYVADQSTSNYLASRLSLSSSLNLDYLQTIEPNLPGGGIRLEGNLLIKDSLVRRRLEALGYRTVGFATGWRPTEVFDADYVLTPGMLEADRLNQEHAFNDFESILVASSGALVLLDFDRLKNTPVAEYVSKRMQTRFAVQRETILGEFENLARVPSLPGPKFVFVHVISPHGPHLFDANGNPIEQVGPFTLAETGNEPVEVERALYRGQAEFITKKLEVAVDAILTKSRRPVVIIVQSDHGPALGPDWRNPDAGLLNARAAILNAYYIPAECREQLYPTITPVNSFRLLFGCLYGDRFPLLADKTYFGGADNLVPIEDVLH